MLGYLFIAPQGVFDAANGKQAMTPKQAERHNAKLAAAELEAWRNKPRAWAGYIVRQHDGRWTLTDFSGHELGRVTYRNIYRNNLGSRTESIRVLGTNGVEYYGRMSADWSQFIRLRAVGG